MSEDKRIAGIYVRVSTEEQSREGFSLQEQEDRLKEFCNFKRYEMFKSTKMPVLVQKMIKDLLIKK